VLPVAVAHGNLSVEVKDESKDAKKAKVSDAITLDATGAVASTPAQALSTADRTPAAAVPPAVQVAEVAPVAPAPTAAGGSKDKKMNHTFMLDGSVTVKRIKSTD
jgi:hypothetical protein